LTDYFGRPGRFEDPLGQTIDTARSQFPVLFQQGVGSWQSWFEVFFTFQKYMMCKILYGGLKQMPRAAIRENKLNEVV
jgi:hypothetical protein